MRKNKPTRVCVIDRKIHRVKNTMFLNLCVNCDGNSISVQSKQAIKSIIPKLELSTSSCTDHQSTGPSVAIPMMDAA